MKTTNTAPRLSHIAWRLLLAWMIAIPASLMSAPLKTTAHNPQSDILPVVGLFTAWLARNRVYRTANAFIDDRNDHYDQLHAKALEQLQARQVGGLRQSQVAAYVKVVVLIEQERRTAIQFAETEKRAARTQFIDKVNNTMVNVMISTNAVTRVLSTMQKGLKSSKDFINRALGELSGAGGGIMADIQSVRQHASYVSLAGGVIGGKTGAQIRSAGNRVVGLIDRPTAEIEAGLNQVSQDLDDLSAIVSDLQTKGYLPGASEVARESLIRLVSREQQDPAVEAILDLLGRGKSGDFRERARTVLIGRSMARCAAIGSRYREILLKYQMPGENQQEISLPACEIDSVTALSGDEPEPETARQETGSTEPERGKPRATAPAVEITPPDGDPAAPFGDLFRGQAMIDFKPKSARAVFEVTDSIFELEIIGGNLKVTLEYTQRSTVREGGEEDGICNVIFTRKLSGDGPWTNPVSLEMKVLSTEILSFEGNICDKRGAFSTTPEEDVLAQFANQPASYRLVGQFSNDTFQGGLEKTFFKLTAKKVER